MAATRHFFIVGAQRSGTTYLARVLDEHPEIEMAKPLDPEPKFFLRADLPNVGKETYVSRYFGDKDGSAWRGEKSTSYCEHEEAIRRLAGWFPAARLLFLARDPVHRAYSNYLLSRRTGWESLPFAEAVRTEEARRDDFDRNLVSASPFAYLRRGIYITQLRMLLRHFDRRQVLILITEETLGQSAAIAQVYRYLEVDPAFVPPSLHSIVNAGDPENGVSISRELDLMLHAHFAPSIALLEQFLGRKIPAWARDAADEPARSC